MAPRRSAPPKPERPALSVEQKRRRIEQLRKCIQDLEAFDPQKVQKRYRVPEVMAIEADIDAALSAAFGHQTEAYNRYSDAATLDHGPHVAHLGLGFGGTANYGSQEAHEAREYFADGRQQSIALLGRAIRALETEITEQEQLEQPALTPSAPALPKNKVFVVHGHDEAALQGVARFLVSIGVGSGPQIGIQKGPPRFAFRTISVRAVGAGRGCGDGASAG
jgi:hypothetical protein